MKKNQIKFSSALILFFAVLLFSGYDASAQRRYRHYRRHHYAIRPHVRVIVPVPPLAFSITPPLVYGPRVTPGYRYYHYRNRDNYHRDHYRYDRRHNYRHDNRNNYRRRDNRDYDRYDNRRNY